MASTNFDSLTESFLQWFQSLPGAMFSESIEIVDLRGRNAGRGIIAKQDIAAETTLFTIPRKDIITTETSQLIKKLPSVFGATADEDTPMDGSNDNDIPEMDSWSALILVLVYEFLQGNESPWKPYFDILPETFDTPMFWSDGELKELQASAVVSKIGKTDAEAMFRERLIPVIRRSADVFTSSHKYSDEDMVRLCHRMGSTIMAYAFDLENEEEKEEEEEEADGWVEDRDGKLLMGMVPMADVLNADAEFNAHVNHGEDELTVTALRTIKAGEEILNYYGPHPNSELLRRYGYVTARHARYDVVEIPWEAVEAALVSQLGLSNETIKQVRDRLDEEELEETFVLERDSPELNADGTFSAPATIAEMPQDLLQQLKTFLKAISKLDPATVPDKRKRDEVQQRVLIAALRAVEARYVTSVGDDEKILAGASGRERMAVEVRVGEKRLLREALAFLEGEEVTGEEEESQQKRVRRN